MPSSVELQSLREAAVLREGGHDILRATGNDRIGFLQRITSGTVTGLEVGRGTETLLLDVRGRVLAHLLLFVRTRSVRIIVPAGQGESVAGGLSKYAIMDDFQIVPESDLASLAVLGPKAAPALVAAGVAVPDGLAEAPLYSHAEVAHATHGPLWVAHGRACGAEGLCVVGSRAARDAIARALRAGGVPLLPDDVAEALRISAMEPKQGAELTPERFPVEVGLGGAIDHGKGCYVGQETIVRMRDRGNVRKRLVLLRLSGAEPPMPGDKLVAPGQPNAGLVTSAAALPGEPPLALAIAASAVAVGTTLEIQSAGRTLAAEIVREVPPWG